MLEIARRLNIGRLAVYSMLEQGIIPGLRLGRRWIITRQAYLTWERPAASGRALDFAPTRGRRGELMPVFKTQIRIWQNRLAISLQRAGCHSRRTAGLISKRGLRQ